MLEKKRSLLSLLGAFGVSDREERPCSFAFSSKTVPSGWKAFVVDLPIPFYRVHAPGANLTQVKSLAAGVKSENYVLVVDVDSQLVLVLRRAKKEDSAPHLFPLKREEDFDRIVSVIRRFNFTSDVLTAHSSMNSVVDLLRVGAERHFINRGLFSSYFLRERLSSHLATRKRNPSRESSALLNKFRGEFPTGYENATRVLEALGYTVEILSGTGYPEYALRAQNLRLNVFCVTAYADSLDIKAGDKAAPSYQAVAALQRGDWVILTNGRIWRLYSTRSSSPSTNYFEVDLEGVAVESDPRLTYFTSIFSASSFTPREGVTDIDLIHGEGVKHAQEVEATLREKVFERDLFLNFVKAVLNHSPSKMRSQEELDQAKSLALKLLYRTLFILYAESRGLLPVDDECYREAALESLRPRLASFKKEPDSTTVWTYLEKLFQMVSKGSVEANLPQYDGALFEEDPILDHLTLRNEFLVPALQDLMEAEGQGIDYQNLGVRHLGSLYEALLENTVRQAGQPLVIYKDEILDAQYAEDLKRKPIGFTEKGELYLSVKGLARKVTGSYYTPDAIVNFLVKKGLEPHFKAREEQFKKDLQLHRQSKTQSEELAKKCTEDLLGLRVVDPAMGSGHFLVAAVNEITSWVINLLKEHPDAPALREIEDYRRTILEEQLRMGIRLNEDLLTDNVILKRLVMKRCIYGVDINPLAVELAKLSLWLDSFTIGTPLTFLDHHIRCGDSLIGLWTKNIAPKALETTLTSWMDTISSAGASLFSAVSMSADLTQEQVAKSRDVYAHVRETTKAQRAQLDVQCAGIIDPKLKESLPRNLAVVEQACKGGDRKEMPKWWASVEELANKKYRFFHWEFEFPDAFTENSRRGFDLIVTNPPWDAVKPEDDDFFSVYDPKFRRISSKPEKREIMEKLLRDKAISEEYKRYRQNIEDRVRFFKESGEYIRRGSGDTNLWKLFLERALNITSEGGGLAIVIPSGIGTDEGGKQLREALFQNRITALFEFENKEGIFSDVDSRYKFVLLIADKGAPTDSFPAAFYLHAIEALEGKVEKEKFVEIPIELVKISAPESLSIPEVRNRKQLEVFSWIYENHPLLGDEKKGWSVALLRELDRTNDSDLFRSDGEGWPLIEGKHFHQFIPDFEKTTFTVSPKEGLERTFKHKEFQRRNKELHMDVRLAFRNVARSTDVRSLKSCILPPRCFCPNSSCIVVPKKDGMVPSGNMYKLMMAYLCGVFNSMVFDFLIRTRISANLNFFYIYQTPVPQSLGDELAKEIIKTSARLSCADERFKEFVTSMDVESGPLSMHDRIQLTAKLDALVAKHYGLDRTQLQVILESFEGFEEDKELERLEEVKWSDTLIRKFNGEVRKRVLTYFDSLGSGREVKPS